ncbi:DUF4189 domain-containing protein [Ochrobactrum quorumnocens]|uniref:DUF4189 domain-containing protein n=1 Tax=Ochrobactrum quorumnocens TaxID=271865 RepID=UPI001FD34C2D|nr:DUF4189 domain-containing protein [[Ochrobactrum] quorumnocens]
MNAVTMIVFVGTMMLSGSNGFSADSLTVPSDIPMPPITGKSADQKGIWAAIAYSESDTKHGFFGGADKRPEAEQAALRHCGKAGGKSCIVVTVFRNYRHWNDDGDTSFPYNHCAALAVSNRSTGRSIWAAKSATNRKEAEDLSLKACAAKGAKCNIREWVCT